MKPNVSLHGFDRFLLSVVSLVLLSYNTNWFIRNNFILKS